MKRLSSKILAAIVTCSATLLLGGLNVHAATNEPSNQTTTARPAKQARFVSSQSRNTLLRYQNQKNQQLSVGRQFSALQLGAKHGRRANRAHQRKLSVRKTNRKQNRNNCRTQKRTSKHVSKYPTLVKPRESVMNQRRSAVNHFKKHVSYVNNQKNGNFDGPEEYGDSDYARKGTAIRSNNSKVVFHCLTFLPKRIGNNQFYSPQGLVITRHYAYVITNATNSYESDADSDQDVDTRNDDISTSPYKLGASQIIRIDLRHHVKDYNNNRKAVRKNVKVGPVFNGGHGQGFTYNPRTGQLWLLDNPEGQVTKSAVSLINSRTLLPMRKINFKFGDTTIGDDLAFDRRGQALNVTEAGSDSFAQPGSIKFFRGTINPYGIKMSLVKQALRWAPTQTIQGLAYNPHNNRLYILGDDAIISLPVAKLGYLKKSDVNLTTFGTTREFEGLSFDRKGRAYLLVSRSPEILIASEFK